MGKRKDGLQKNSEKFQNIIVEGDKKKKKIDAWMELMAMDLGRLIP